MEAYAPTQRVTSSTYRKRAAGGANECASDDSSAPTSAGTPIPSCRAPDGSADQQQAGDSKRRRTTALLQNQGGDAVTHMTLPSIHKPLTLTSIEEEWLRKYVLVLNAYLPMVSEQMLTLAMRPVAAEAAGEAVARGHACRATLWGCISLGALLSQCSAQAEHCNKQAQLELRECFDAAVPELCSAFLVLAMYYLCRLDMCKMERYAGFAQLSLSELGDVPPSLTAAVHMLQVSLFLSGVGDPPKVALPERCDAAQLTPLQAKQRSLQILAFAMMSIYASQCPASQGPSVTVPCESDEHLLSLVQTLPLLLQRYQRPDGMSRVIGNVLTGYLLLRTGNIPQAISIIEETAQCICSDPASLHFPLTWALACCVLEGLRRFRRRALLQRLVDAMSPLAGRLAFATKCCSVSARLLTEYAGAAAPVDGGDAQRRAQQVQRQQQAEAREIELQLRQQSYQLHHHLPHHHQQRFGDGSQSARAAPTLELPTPAFPQDCTFQVPPQPVAALLPPRALKPPPFGRIKVTVRPAAPPHAKRAPRSYATTFTSDHSATPSPPSVIPGLDAADVARVLALAGGGDLSSGDLDALLLQDVFCVGAR
eukprot:TRINITY_DN19827_c0_g1_i1.p1 TRINITY_DN19827_c0_g1~~TRINITY_DN19827_c0_g1_i1.p1  ORF type:complete len:595 (-),score=143.71 TRINITY_DN19827_c0_g1_i1:431-2215(-)